MLRHKSLHPLSHQHQHALALCVAIQRGMGEPAVDLAALVQRAESELAGEIRAHFELEERVLFPVVEAELGPMELTGRLRGEHQRIAALAEALRGARQREALGELATLLQRHVRTEENELFEQIQTLLRPSTLESLGAALDRRSAQDRPSKGTPMTDLLQSSIPGLPLVARGKVRDVYAAGPDKLLMIATDRISAFDCVLPNPIPGKGRVLTQISLFWFDFLKDVVPNHLITACVDEYPAELHPYRDELEGRSMLVHKARMIGIECVARGFLAGSGWKEYRAHGTVCGIPLPPGLDECSRLPEPLFTPAYKAQTGHDENITFDQAAAIAGAGTATRLRDLTLAIYRKAAAYAESRGILLADTKFEFGWLGGELILGDEVLTPDSSRFWPGDQYRPGRPQPSFDKQYVRDYLETLDWNKQPPAPVLPKEVVLKTAEKYHDAYRRLTGKSL